MTHTFTPRGVCSTKITFDLTDGKIHDLTFTGGCNGNLKAIAKLVEGMEADAVIEKLAGNDCGGRGTSCADQLTMALREAKAVEHA